MSDASSGGGYGRPPKRKRKPQPAPGPPAPRSEAAAGGGYQRPAKTASSSVFTNPLMRGGALHEQQRQQRDEVRKAQDRLPGPAVDLPRLPRLEHYTPAQRQEIIRRTSAAVRRAASSGALDPFFAREKGEESLWQKLGHLTDRQTREAVHKYAGAVKTAQRNTDAAVGAQWAQTHLSPVAPTLANLTRIGREIRDRQLTADTAAAGQIKPGGPDHSVGHALLSSLEDRAQMGGFNFVKGLEGDFRLATLPVQLARATAEDPSGVAKASLRTAVDSIAGIPQGVAALISHPGKALDAMAQDYSRRYGPLIKGNSAEFRRRVEQESGLTPFALDTGGAGAVGGRALGAAARTATVGRAAEVLSAAREPILSRVLKAAHTTATMDRPALRFSGGEAGAIAQETSPNLFKAAGQRGLDAARKSRHDRELARANLRQLPDGRLVRRDPAKPAGRAPGLRPGEHEVLPYYSLREAPGIRGFASRQRRNVAEAKATGRIALLSTRARELAKVDKTIRKLSAPERDALKYAIQLGLPEDATVAVRMLERRRAQIRRERNLTPKRELPPVLAETNDELAVINRILKDPERHLTPRMRQAADDLMAVQRRTESLDPDLTPEQTLIRRTTPQAAALGLVRKPDSEAFLQHLDGLEQNLRDHGMKIEPGALRAAHEGTALEMPKDRPAAARNVEATYARSVVAAERAVHTAERRAQATRAVRREREERGAPIETDHVRTARAEVSKLKRARKEIQRQLHQAQRRSSRAVGQTEGRFAAGRMTEGASRKAADASATVDELKGALEYMDGKLTGARANLDCALNAAPRVSEALARREARAEAAVTAARATRDEARDLHKAMRAATRATRRSETQKMESAAEFADRVEKAARDAGLKEPGYWASSVRPEHSYSYAAIGGGGRGVAGSKRYTGELFRLGVEEHGPDVLARGIERNIKRRFSWALVERNMETHAFEWSRGQHGGGLTAKELLHELDRRQIDPRTVSFINTRVLRRGEHDAEGAARGDVVAADEGVLDDQALREVHTDLQDASTSMEQLAEDAREGIRKQAANRYLVVPADVADEMLAVTKPDGAGWRMVEMLLASKPARVMLGTNPGWLLFQIANNAFLTGLGGGVNPFNVYGAAKWWKSLSREERDAIEPYLGIGYHPVRDEPRLGATAENMRLVNAYHAFQKTKVGRALHHGNAPSRFMDLMFFLDRAQTNFFRRVLFYSKAKRAAYSRMSRSIGGTMRAQAKLAEILGTPPEKLGAAIVKSGPEFERHARLVNKWLGDYASFTARERAFLRRNVMFYGYLRYSLRFAFWTMPWEHPVTTAMIGNLGRLGADEIRNLFGLPRGYSLPASMLGRVYFGADAKQIHDYVASNGRRGKLPDSENIGRLNPGLNSITQLERPQQIAGFVSPLYQAFADQVFNESTFTGRPFKINGQPAPYGPDADYGSFLSLFAPWNYAIPGLTEGHPRNRILERDLLGLAAPYRAAEKAVPGMLGPQGDDSLLWDPRPTHYSAKTRRGREINASIKREIAQQQEQPAWLRALASIGGVIPQRDVGPVIAQRQLDQAQPKKKHRRQRSTGFRFDYGGRYGGSAYGGSTSGYRFRYGG